VRRTCEGDRRAFGELVERYRDMVYGLAYHLTGEFEAARDLAQEGFVQAYLKLKALREPEKFAGWLRRIVVNLHRMQRRRPEVPTVRLEQEVESPQAGPGLSEIEVAVRQALGRLREPERLALTLHYINGYSHAEIGGFLGVRAATVKTRLARARQHLRQEVVAMVEETFEGNKLPAGFTQEAVDAAVARAEGHLKRGQVGDAVKGYEALLERDGDYVPALVGLGRAHQASGRDDQAVRHLRRALDLDPQNQMAYGYMSQILAGSQRHGEMIAFHEERLKVEPERAALHHAYLANLCIAVRNYDAAERHLRAVAEMNPDDLSAKSILADMLAIHGRHDEAVALLEETARPLAEHPGGWTGYEWNRWRLAEIHSASGNHAQAIETARRVLLHERTSICDRIVERCLMVVERSLQRTSRLDGFPAWCRDLRRRMTDRGRRDRVSWYLALFLEGQLRRGRAVAEFERLGAIPARCWRVAVPFDNTDGRGMATAYPPEQGLALGDSCIAPGGQRIEWTRPMWTGAGFELGFLPQIQLSLVYEWAVGYGLLQVVSPRARDVRLRFGASGWTQVWLNGRSVFLDHTATGIPDQQVATLRLKRGPNDILVKVGVQAAMPSVRGFFYYWSLFSRITNAAGEPLRDLELPLAE